MQIACDNAQASEKVREARFSQKDASLSSVGLIVSFLYKKRSKQIKKC